jgi:PIN domain nuclease of toxin-antitoxin system
MTAVLLDAHAWAWSLSGDARLSKPAVAGFDPVVCLIAGMMDWPHRDPFDRLLAATAMHYKLPLVSADAVFDGIVTRLC